MTDLVVRDVTEADADAWVELYSGYRSFYRLAPSEQAVATTWRWIVGREHGLRGLVAADENGTVLALANLRLFARPSVGRLGLYLDDLFTSPAARGRGAASALLDRAAALAAEEDAVVVRWITAADNTVARRLYDEHAVATNFITYDMQPAT